MKRAISLLLALAAAAQAACGSTGSQPGSTYFASEPGRSAPPNTQQADPNPSGPLTNSNQPFPSFTAPPTNPNAPPLPDQGRLPGSSGGGIFIPNQSFCTTICAGVADSVCDGQCLGRCAAYLVLFSRCPAQVSAAAACVQQLGFICDEQGELRLATEQCDAIVNALESCGSSTIPIPTSTGIPNEPPPPPFDGGR